MHDFYFPHRTVASVFQNVVIQLAKANESTDAENDACQHNALTCQAFKHVRRLRYSEESDRSNEAKHPEENALLHVRRLLTSAEYVQPI